MKNLLLLILCFSAQIVFAHDLSQEHQALKSWHFQTENKTIDASFLMFKNGEVYLEKADQEVLHFPLTALAAADQAIVRQKYAAIAQLNRQRSQPTGSPESSSPFFWIMGAMLLLAARLFFLVDRRLRRLYLSGAAAMTVIFAGLSFKSANVLLPNTDPAFIDAAFAPFKPKVNTFWDADYFYVESKGIPDHQMMTGITSWQQQVPIPQCYIGNNAWSIPLNPVIAATPVPVSPDHFTRGAVAIAANGVPIFNPYTNTGVDALLTGQLDNFGGHCGRADDYHYHIAPLQLDDQTADILPIAFALDGFAVYGPLEPDGTAMTPLDANHGHYGADGEYHYHGTASAPYMIGNMVGEVTEDNTMQIVPQAAASPIRPAGMPLSGATITDCQPVGSNGYHLVYTRNGQTYSIDYSWTDNGQYTFHFNSPTGTTTENYNGFLQCEVPVATADIFQNNQEVILYPNPANEAFTLLLDDRINPTVIHGITLYDQNGKQVYKTNHFKKNIDIKSLSKGVYLVEIQWLDKVVTQKLLVE